VPGDWNTTKRRSWCSRSERFRSTAPSASCSQAWSFGFRGVCQEAYEETQGNCVAHQLEAALRRTLPLETAMTLRGSSNLEFHFDTIFEELYPMGRKTTRTCPKASAAPGKMSV
jgi:hypothetical protein